MPNLNSYVPEAIRKKIKHTNDEELIKATKKHYLFEISKWYSGSSIIENLTERYELPFGYHGADPQGDLSEKLTLQEIYYYFTHILTSKVNSYLFNFKTNKQLIEMYRKNIIANNFFGDYGLPIWDEQLGYKPKLWICQKEDKKFNCVCFLFINSAGKKKFYNIVTHEIQSVDVAGLVRCRMHLDNGIMEMAIRDYHLSEKDLEPILNYINTTVGLNPLSPIKISDGDLRKFDQHSLVEKITHERRIGANASTTLTRVTEDGDTRDDEIRAEIEDRELKLEHGQINVQGKKVKVTVKAGKYGSIRYHSFLIPEEQIAAFKIIRSIFGW